MAARGRGRPRDPGIDDRVLAAARHELAVHGYEGLSVRAVADAAGTTRQAVYRRFASRADLATAAIAAMSRAEHRPATDDPYRDLVRELRAFRRGISRPDGLSMVGTMLHSSTDPELVALFRQRLVQPRRRRLAAILERGRAAGLLDPDADLEVAVTMCTGSWYAAALTGRRPPARWPERVAALVWRSAGGTPPTAGAGES